MANLNAPNGFRVVNYAFGRGEYCGNVTKYWFNGGSIIGTGDPVVRVTGSGVSDPQGIGSTIARQAGGGGYVTGHIVGFDPVPDALTEVGYMLSADTGYVYVADDPGMVLVVQEGGAGTALTTANIGQSINAISAVNADTTIGSSLMQLNNASVTTASTGTYIIVGLVQKADNAVGQYAKWLVRVNLSTEAVSGASNILAI